MYHIESALLNTKRVSAIANVQQKVPSARLLIALNQRSIGQQTTYCVESTVCLIQRDLTNQTPIRLRSCL